MARKKRVWWPGAGYHIMSRGNHRLEIFRDDEDRYVYLCMLTQVKDRYPFILHAYCLMSNHVHFQLETIGTDPGKIMKLLNMKYAIFFNKKYRFVGQLMQGRFQAEVIEDDRYFLALNRYIHLNPVKGVGPVTLRNLIMKFGSPQAVYSATQADLNATPGLRSQVLETILDSRSMDQAKQTEELMLRLEIKLLTFVDPLYSPGANKLPNQPAVLYYKGNLRPPQISVGIVGSRRCTTYGKQVTTEAASFLAQQGITVVSGLAKGIDSYAHTACLKAGGYTLAFIANGPDLCYPLEHRSLMDEIIEKGAVLSPYPPGTRPRQEYFPLRNRLLSAWVDQLLVVEAGERSGALITAGYAMEQKRRVFAVPNSIYSPESFGTNRLLQTGAEIYLEPKQLLNLVDESLQLQSTDTVTSDLSAQPNPTRKRPETETLISSPEERLILERLRFNNPENSVGIRDFLDLFDGNLKALISRLCSMELEGQVIVLGQTVRLTRVINSKTSDRAHGV